MLGLSCSSLKAGSRQWSSRGKVNLGPSSEIEGCVGQWAVKIGDLTVGQSTVLLAYCGLVFKNRRNVI